MKNIQNVRTDYVKGVLNLQDLQDSPGQQLSSWLQDAIKAEALDANAFCLSTINSKGFPRGRNVLVKGVEEEAILFYTNKRSSKSADLSFNPKAGATFFWPELERQVCIYGNVTELSDQENDSYFASRPRESQLGAWVSKQSQPLSSREELDATLKAVREKYKDLDVIDRPNHWGGFRIAFVSVEFWQGRASRLHDRIVYRKSKSGQWEKYLLQP
tara:strand:- start:213 stop:857 length:645 start_codon:yes stop_codon:yes gene_type:complete